MGALDVARRYFEAWNRRDPAGVAGMFADGGTYRDPATGSPLGGSAIAGYVQGLVTAFPDLSFEIVSAATTGDSTVAAQWLMRGTNTGPIQSAPPTHRTVALPGADFLVIAGDKVGAVEGYFDQKTLTEQLGFQVAAMPPAAGPVSFGVATYLQTGNRTRPGAISLTAIQVRSDKEASRVIDYSRRIMQEMARIPGFISFVGTVIGHRLMTISAWYGADKPAQLLRGGAHKEAMEAFFGPDFAAGGVTGVWVPHHINTMWVRCTSCGQMVDAEQEVCRCDNTLPPHPAYW